MLVWSPDESTLKHSPTHFGLCFFMDHFLIKLIDGFASIADISD